jgi:hypothetical protein
VPLDSFTEHHQISVTTCLDNGLFGGKEFVNICRRHAQLGRDIRHGCFSETELTKQLVGFDHDPLTRFIAGQTFAGSLGGGGDKSDKVYYSSHICLVKWSECSWPQESAKTRHEIRVRERIRMP